jgi:hypothetical protein
MVRVSRPLRFVVLAGLALVLVGKPSRAAPPTNTPPPAADPGQQGRFHFKLKRTTEGNFTYFLAALPAIVGMGLGARAVGRRFRRGLPARRATLSAGAAGAAFGGGVAAAFLWTFGSPDGQPGSAIFLGAVFVVCGAQTGWKAARQESPTAGEQSSPPPREASAS